MTKLFSPTGEPYETNDNVEVRRLINMGYSEKKPTPTEVKVATGEKPPTSS